MTTMIEEANARTMDRYRKMVQIEMSKDAVHVTIDGEHYVNDSAKLGEALRRIADGRKKLSA